jgi:hypothetical protein
MHKHQQYSRKYVEAGRTSTILARAVKKKFLIGTQRPDSEISANKAL